MAHTRPRQVLVPGNPLRTMAMEFAHHRRLRRGRHLGVGGPGRLRRGAYDESQRRNAGDRDFLDLPGAADPAVPAVVAAYCRARAAELVVVDGAGLSDLYY